jgi:hypothetical protein
MTRKDYLELAKIMRNLREYIEPRTREGRGFDEAVSQMLEWLELDNPRFDSSRFEQAIYGKNA